MLVKMLMAVDGGAWAGATETAATTGAAVALGTGVSDTVRLKRAKQQKCDICAEYFPVVGSNVVGRSVQVPVFAS